MNKIVTSVCDLTDLLATMNPVMIEDEVVFVTIGDLQLDVPAIPTIKGVLDPCNLPVIS